MKFIRIQVNPNGTISATSSKIFETENLSIKLIIDFTKLIDADDFHKWVEIKAPSRAVATLPLLSNQTTDAILYVDITNAFTIEGELQIQPFITKMDGEELVKSIFSPLKVPVAGFLSGDGELPSEDQATLDQLVEQVLTINEQLLGKAPSVHGHIISEVTSLRDELDDKAPIDNPTFSGEVTADEFQLTDASKSLRNFMAYWDSTASASRLYGGKLTDNGDGTIHVAAGGGLIKVVDVRVNDLECGIECAPPSLDDGQSSKTSFITWDELSSLSLTNHAYNYIYYEGSTGLVKATTDYYSISFTRDFTLGRAFRTGNDVVLRLCGTNGWNFNRRVQLFGEEVFPVVRAFGLNAGFSGRTITFTGGVLWAELVNRFTIETYASSTTPFTTWRRDGLGGWVRTDGQTLLNNTQWDNGSGALQPLLINRVGVHWFYVVHDGTAHVVFGQGNYTQAQADIAPLPATLPPLLAAYATLIGKYQILANAATIQSIQSPNTQTFTQSAVNNHNELSGIQGGAANEYYHLTLEQYTKLVAFLETI